MVSLMLRSSLHTNCSNTVSGAVNIRTKATKSGLKGFSFEFKRRNVPDLVTSTNVTLMYSNYEKNIPLHW